MSNDIIEIHNSDRALFKTCRQKWEFSAPSKMNLRPKVSYLGVNFNLWFGSLIHAALEEYYHPILRRDPVEVFETVYSEGTFNSKNQQDVPGVRWLNNHANAFYMQNKEEIESLRELGVDILTHYTNSFAPQHDNFDVIAVEQDFQVELFEAVDPRDGVKKPVVYCGKMDAIVQDKDTGRISILDHKTSARIDEDFFVKLEMDEQCTSYVWAAHKMLGQEFGAVKGIWYNVLRKAAPRYPTLTYKGNALSLNKAEESTTPELFRQALEDHNLFEWFDTNVKAQDYLEWLETDQSAKFFLRQWVPRNTHELASFERQLVDELYDMVENPRIYRSPSSGFWCTRCEFRAPCLAKYDGSDHQFMLDNNYELNTNRG